MASKAWNLVKQNIDNGNIREWTRIMTEEQIALSCGISYSSFQNFKKKYKELEDELVKGKMLLCQDLKSALIKKAKGYEYEETTTQVIEKDGKKTKEIKKVIKHIPPDTGAIHLLLKNNDSTWHNDDSIVLELKKQELELKKQLAAKEEQIIELTSSLNDLLSSIGSENIDE